MGDSRFAPVSGWIVALGIGLAAAPAAAEEAWPDLKEALFGERVIHDGAGVIGLEAPYRAQDAAIVPITMTAEIPQTAERYIKTVTLVVDENPAPVAAVFTMTPWTGSATIATRIRVNAYSEVRAIAETSDGELYMASRFVKASGGCSAPALKDQDASLARLGRMKLKQPAELKMSRPNQVQLLISHPNYSGLQMDQVTRHYLPAMFIQELKVTYQDRPLLKVEGGISLSENPSLHFSFVPDGPAGEIGVWARDTDGNVFEERWRVAPGGAAS